MDREAKLNIPAPNPETVLITASLSEVAFFAEFSNSRDIFALGFAILYIYCRF